VVDPADVQPWIDIRLGRRAPEPIAARLGISTDALRMRMSRADERLAVALTDGLLSGMVSQQTTRRLSRQARLRSAHRRPADQTAGGGTTAA
jgi:hypothetical protein